MYNILYKYMYGYMQPFLYESLRYKILIKIFSILFQKKKPSHDLFYKIHIVNKKALSFHKLNFMFI